ncbi:MAG: GNAT family N-acetyltransferase [Candidatus Bipolaricaulaceae bacterium]
MQLITPRLLIRNLASADLGPLAAMWADPAVTRHLGGPRDPQEVRAVLAREAERPESSPLGLWPVEERRTGEVIGHCGLVEKDINGKREVELVYVFTRWCWGRGYGTEAAAAIRDYGLGELRLPRLVALIPPENSASAQVARRVGMRRVDSVRRPDGRMLDLYALERCRRDRERGTNGVAA